MPKQGTSSMRKSLLSAILVTVLALCARPADAGYIVTDLGTLGGQISEAYAINELGQITGYSHNGAGPALAFLYSNGVMQNLGALATGRSSYGLSINDLGQVVGFGESNTNYNHGMAYTGGSMLDLGTLGGRSSYATGVNNSSEVVGYSDTSGGQQRAVLLSGGTTTVLPTLGGNNGQAYAINNSGQVTGTAEIAGGQQRAFLYSGGTIHDLGILSPGGISFGTAINNAGQVAGYATVDVGIGMDTHAFLYSNGIMQDLGVLAGSQYSKANGINDLGQVVGISTSGGLIRGFLYSNGSMQNLSDLLAPVSAGWQIYQASDINNRGQIVGTGLYNGQMHAVLLTPQEVPEPASLALLGSGILGLCGYRARRKKCSKAFFAPLALALGLAFMPQSADAGIVYSNNFESNATGFSNAGVLPALTRTSLPTDGLGLGSPNQSMWLGRLGQGVAKSASSQEIVNLSVSGLTAGVTYTVAFDLLIGRSWDGAASGPWGGDAWYFAVNSTRLVDTMFSNGNQGSDYGAFSPQRYTDTNYATPTGPNVPAFTGAEYFRKQTISSPYDGYYGIYYFSHGAGNPNLTFVATGTTAALQWARYSTASNSGDSSDEYWALDNVVVSSPVSAVPEPSSLVLAAIGLTGVITGRRRLRNQTIVAGA